MTGRPGGAALRMAAAGAGACAVAAILAQGGRVADFLDLLTHFAPIYAAVGAAAVLAGLLARRRGRAALALGAAALAAGGALMAPEWLRPPAPVASHDAAGRLKIIHVNAKRTNADIGPIAAWLIAQDPDIVTVTEARHDLRDLLRRRTGWALAGAKGNLMIFTRKPRLEMRRPKLRPDDDLNFVNATYVDEFGPYEVVTGHLSWPIGDTARRQLPALLRVLHERPRARMILTGDLNLTPWSFALQQLDARSGLSRRTQALFSFPSAAWLPPLLPIDHVYAGPAWATVSVQRGPRLAGADHYPVVVVLAPRR